MRRLASWIDSRLRDSAGALSTRLRRADTSAGGQSTGSFSTEGGTVSKTACIAEECTPTKWLTCTETGYAANTVPDEFKIIVNGEPVAISSSRYFREVVRESFQARYWLHHRLPAGCRVR
jgi:hypothetical protein